MSSLPPARLHKIHSNATIQPVHGFTNTCSTKIDCAHLHIKYCTTGTLRGWIKATTLSLLLTSTN